MLIPGVDPLADPLWNTYLLHTPGASIFHTTHWLRVLQEAYGYQPYYFATVKDSQLLHLLPFVEVKSWLTGRRGVAMPFADYCDPILLQALTPQEALGQVMRTAQQRQWQCLEMRGGEVWDAEAPAYARYERHVLPLQAGSEAVFRGLRSNYRAKIRKAQHHGLKMSLCQAPAAMAEYYRLHCLTRQRQGIPPQPARFFQKIQEHLIANQRGFVTLVSHQGRNIAGAVFLTFATQALYKFGASDLRYQHLYPNYGLFWHVIEWLCQQSYHELCFGRTDPGNTGLSQFKAGWGTQKTAITYYRYDLRQGSFVPPSRPPGRLPASLLQKLPLPLLKLAGAVLYKHIG